MLIPYWDKIAPVQGNWILRILSNLRLRAAIISLLLENMARPGEDPVPEWDAPDFDNLIDNIVEARQNGHPVVWFMGAHVIKNGLSRYLIELIKRGIVTHVAGNGAGSIHDFELAYNGETSEDVPTAIEDGSFGMWEETGRWMNEAIQMGAERNLGYGESLAVYVEENPEKFPNKEDCVFYQCYLHGVPITYHIALGTDIIHQHPIVNFEAIGKCSGIDFHKFCYTIAQLNKGVFLNFGSAVLGPEVFLKALLISVNLGFPTLDITTANFDLINLGDDKCKIGYDDPNYYYRPRKNIVNRPTQQSKRGWHFVGDHKGEIPNLYARVIERMPSVEKCD